MPHFRKRITEVFSKIFPLCIWPILCKSISTARWTHISNVSMQICISACDILLNIICEYEKKPTIIEWYLDKKMGIVPYNSECKKQRCLIAVL